MVKVVQALIVMTKTLCMKLALIVIMQDPAPQFSLSVYF